jgi:periplasmic protein TonB
LHIRVELRDIALVAGAMASPTQHRGRISALISIIVHAVLLAALAVTSIQIASEDRQLLPLVIREPAPPPPPPGPGGTGPPAPLAHVVAPVEPRAFVNQPKPIEAPQPVERPKIAARPKPKQDISTRQPTPAPAQPPTSEIVSAPAAPGGDAGSGVAGGVIGGVAGGKVGGKVGGRLGGTGDDVWSIDQVAVPPKVVDAVRPQYPVMARARGQEGVVVVQAIIDRHGAVEPGALQVIQSLPPFDDAAVAAFRQWKFQPGRNDSGEVVRVLVQQPIRFQLR